MGVDGHMLLKMLEPAIRPGPMGGSDRPARLPVEQQSFEELLSQRMTPVIEADDTDASAADGKAASASKGSGPLGQLARVDQIENASLRDLIARHADERAMNQEL